MMIHLLVIVIIHDSNTEGSLFIHSLLFEPLRLAQLLDVGVKDRDANGPKQLARLNQRI